ncbi:MAG: caspase family protein [Cyclobacteriaceae bacterium]
MKKLLIILCTLVLISEVHAQKPELKVQAGHMTFITGLQFSPSSEHIFTAALDGNIKKWETATGREIKNISTGSVMYDFELSEDGNIAWVSDLMGNVSGWDLNSGLSISNTPIKSMMAAHAGLATTTQVYRPIALKGNHLAVANQGDAMANILKLDKLKGKISIYDASSGKQKTEMKQNDAAISAITFASEQTLVTADKNNNIKVWDTSKGKEIKKINSGQSNIFTIAANDSHIVSGGSSGSIKIWDLSSGKKVFSLNSHTGDVTNVEISKDGSTVISNDKFSTKSWDLSSGKEIFDNKVQNVSGGFANANNVVTISNDNSLYASSWFGVVNIYDQKSNRFLKRLEGNDSGLIGNLFFPGTNNPGMVYQGADRIIAKGWEYPNAISKTIRVNVSGKAVKVHPKLESVIVYSPSTENTISVISFDTGEEMCKISGHTDVIHRAIYNHDGSQIITASKDNSIRSWDSQTGQELKKISRRGFASTGFNGGLFISRDGKTVLAQGLQAAYGSTPTPTQVWNLETGKSINLTGVYFAGTPVVSPDGKMIAGMVSVMKKKEPIPQLIIYDTSNGNRIGEFKDQTGSMYMSFSADSKSLALTMPDGVDVLDIATEEIKYKLDHVSVNHYAFSDDNSLIMTYGADGLSRLWESSTGKEIAALVSFRDNENTIVLPNRYYYSTKGAIRGIHYILEDRAVPFDQFDLQYNRPDLVFKALGISDQKLLDGYKKAYEKRLSKNGVTESMLADEFHLPQVSIETADIPITTTDKKLSLTFSAQDSRYNLSRIIVAVNNIPIYGKQGLPTGTSNSFDKEVEIELSEGRNKIGVMSVNEKGIKSIEEVIEIQYTAAATKPDLYLVVIGVSEYISSEMNLTYAAKDANDIVSAFQSKSGNYGNIIVLKYINENATTSNILSAKESLSKSKVDDEVVVFLAGHGVLDANLDYYLATHDMDFLNPAEKGLKYEDLEGLLDAIPARKKVMLLDACHSGEVDKEAEGEQTASSVSTTGNIKFRGFNSASGNALGLQNSFKMMQELFADLRRGTGAIVISSASGAEYAYESPEWNNGVFTYSLLEGIKTANCDENKDGEIRMSELRNYVMKRVVELTNGNQHPTSRSENLEFDFKVW